MHTGTYANGKHYIYSNGTRYNICDALYNRLNALVANGDLALAEEVATDVVSILKERSA